MITAVCLNPSIDRTLCVPAFTYGGMNRVEDAREDASGKGVNVAIACAQLGAASECVGFLGRENGWKIEKRLAANGVGGDFVWMEGAIRTNVKLLDRAKGAVTEINERGRAVSREDVDRMTSLVCEHIASTDMLVLAGSMPPGCPKGLYREWIEEAEEVGCRCVLDAEGEVLSLGVAAKPFLMKPNVSELEGLVGRKLDTVEEVRDAALGLIERGVCVVAASLGERGALMTDGDETWYAPRIEVSPKSTVGAGDAMVAALSAGFVAGKPFEEVFAMGVASGTASVLTEGTQLVDPEVYQGLLERVALKRI